MNARKKLIIPFLLPSMALVAVFFILPALQTIVLSLQDWDGTFRTTGFKGLENYFRLFQDQLFIDAVGHTFAYFVIITLLLFPIGLFLAVALQRIKRYKMFIQFCIFMPVTLSVVVAAVLWKWYIYDPNMGIINTFLRAIGLDSLAHPWLGDSKTALVAVIVMSTWHGIATWVIMIISGLDRIPSELIEAARLDGAGELTVFFKVTLPLLWEVLSSLLILSFINAMQQFPVIFAMTQGGPYGSTEVMGTYLYKIAFEGKMFSYGSAMAIVMAVIVLVVSSTGNKFIKTETIQY